VANLFSQEFAGHRLLGDDALKPLGLLVIDVRLTTFQARFAAGQKFVTPRGQRRGSYAVAATDTLEVGTPQEL
jgi:hypothetical protein